MGWWDPAEDGDFTTSPEVKAKLDKRYGVEGVTRKEFEVNLTAYL